MKTKDIHVMDALSGDRYNNKKIKMHRIMIVVVLLLISALLLGLAWEKHQKAVETEAVILAQSIESTLHPEHIEKLSLSSKHLEEPEYIMAKGSLTRLARSSDLIKSAYLMTQHNDEIIMMVDSLLRGSPEYSPSLETYVKAADIYNKDSQSEKALATNPVSDRWGTWVSVLVPVRNPVNDEILAVLGIDYDTTQQYVGLWKRMIPDIIIVFTLFFLFFALLYSGRLRRRAAMDEALYHSVFNQAPTGIAIVEDKHFTTQMKFNYKNMNPMFEDILGRTSGDLENIKWPDITHPEDLQADLEKFEQFKKGEISGYSMEKRFIKPDGSSVWTNMKIAPLLEGLDRHFMHLCLLEDISKRKQARDALRESERGKSVLLSNLPGMAYRCDYDKQWTMQFVSDGCFALTGYTPEDLVFNKTLSYKDVILPEYRESIWEEWKDILAKKSSFQYEYEILTATGERKWVMEKGEGVYGEKDQIESLEGIVLDISDRKEMERGLKFNMDHDIWTGLYNRRYLEKSLNKDGTSLEMRKRALVCINLGEFSTQNMFYSFQYRQELIWEIAKVLKTYSTEQHQLFKTYANRFVFYVKDYHDKNELLEFSQSIDRKLEDLLAVERIAVGFGIIEIKEEYKDKVDKLLNNVLIASEETFNILETDSKINFFNKEMEARVMRKDTIKRELAEIAAGKNKHRLFLQFQPILDLHSNLICEFEALARLNTHALGPVPPMEFIPLAEETKLIIPLGKKIIREAFDFLNDLYQKGMKGIGISINISTIQLLKKDFAKDLLELVDDMQVNPNKITLEITESVVTYNYKEMQSIITEIRDVGIKIAIDDFGTEYSSFAKVRELNVDCLKIDQYFIDKLLELEPEEAITGGIISMAHKLGHCVIAEGIEYEEQLQYLKEHNCDKIQGYLIGKPLDKELAIELIEDQKNKKGGCDKGKNK